MVQSPAESLSSHFISVGAFEMILADSTVPLGVETASIPVAKSKPLPVIVYSFIISLGAVAGEMLLGTGEPGAEGSPVAVLMGSPPLFVDVRPMSSITVTSQTPAVFSAGWAANVHVTWDRLERTVWASSSTNFVGSVSRTVRMLLRLLPLNFKVTGFAVGSFVSGSTPDTSGAARDISLVARIDAVPK